MDDVSFDWWTDARTGTYVRTRGAVVAKASGTNIRRYVVSPRLRWLRRAVDTGRSFAFRICFMAAVGLRQSSTSDALVSPSRVGGGLQRARLPVACGDIFAADEDFAVIGEFVSFAILARMRGEGAGGFRQRQRALGERLALKHRRRRNPNLEERRHGGAHLVHIVNCHRNLRLSP